MKSILKTMTIAILSIVFIFLCSCEQTPDASYGKLSVSLVESKAIEVDREKYELTSFKLYATYQNGVDTIEESFSTASYTVEEMKVGLWSVYIEGYNSEGSHIASSEAQVLEISAGTNNSATFNLEYLESVADGSFSIKIKLPAGYLNLSRAKGTITQQGIIPEKTFEAAERQNEGEYDYFVWEEALAPGTYVVKVELFDLEGEAFDVSHIETVEIAPNEKTEGNIIFEQKDIPGDLIRFSAEKGDGYEYVITMETSTKDAKIYYTLDGSEPTRWSNEYSGPITRTIITHIKAITLADNTRTYISEFDLIARGPAGGYVFYDCDADNTEEDPDGADNLLSTTCGWRCLEAAPADLRVVDGIPTVNSTLDGYASADSKYLFGFYRESSYGSNLYVNGTTSYDSSNCTLESIGSGKSNTEKLVAAMGTGAYTNYSGSGTTSSYAARLCSALEHGGYDDWFLPSMNERIKMYYNLHVKGYGDFQSGYDGYYWSSSEIPDYADCAWDQGFKYGNQSRSNRDDFSCIRPCRAF